MDRCLSLLWTEGEAEIWKSQKKLNRVVLVYLEQAVDMALAKRTGTIDLILNPPDPSVLMVADLIGLIKQDEDHILIVNPGPAEGLVSKVVETFGRVLPVAQQGAVVV